MSQHMWHLVFLETWSDMGDEYDSSDIREYLELRKDNECIEYLVRHSIDHGLYGLSLQLGQENWATYSISRDNKKLKVTFKNELYEYDLASVTTCMESVTPGGVTRDFGETLYL